MRSERASRMRSLIAAMACILSLAACGQSIDTAEWTEEVLLSDGRLVVVWRRDHRASHGFPNARRGGLIDFELKYEPMHVHWKDVASPTRVRYPRSLDIIDGVPHLVLSGSSDVCVDRPATDYAAEFLKWVGGRWVSVPQAAFPVDRVLVNLYQGQWGYSTKDDAHGLISWQLKAERDGFNPDKADTVKAYFERSGRICANRRR